MPLEPTTRTPVCSSVPPLAGERERGERGGLLSGRSSSSLGRTCSTMRPATFSAESTPAPTAANMSSGEEWLVARATSSRMPEGTFPIRCFFRRARIFSRPEAQVVLAVGLVEELPDLVPRAPALDHGQPVAARPRVLARDDLDPVARDQLGVEGHDPVVDPGPYGAVADLGVDVVGEVYRRSPARKADHVALRRKDEDLVGDELALQRLHELRWRRSSPSATPSCS